MTRINTNVFSLVSTRNLNTNNNALSTSLERLSTGLRVNKGKDDPAGLIASERLRAEMAAINAAIDNAERADNMIAVAEGGLQEISSLLIELEGLVDRSANEAGLSAEELAANQLEVDTILETINRIATSTEFSGKKLLNGSLDYTTSSLPASGITDLRINSARLAEGSSKSVVIQVTGSAQAASLVYNGATTASSTTTIQVSGKYGTEQFTFGSSTNASAVVAAVQSAKSLTGVSARISGGNIVFNSTEFGSDAFVSVEALQGTFAVTGGSSATKDYGQDVEATVNGIKAITKGLNVSVRSASLNIDATLSAWVASRPNQTRTFTINGGGANFSIAPTQGVNAMASIGIQSVATGNLGSQGLGFLSSLGSGQANQLSEGKFETAQRIIREASSQVASLRGRLGAFQKNTLTSAMNSLKVTLENVTAAESAIRDTDFALETSRLTRAQILVNSSTTTLQQANAMPQNALALLR
ncbi:MAG TPA: flagellin [Phycisphaerae bacterium]|jgi:flagellin|nr:flagellin [Phycisphaerae bacterium]HOB75268.1 flagellin [Phycisphaerae bacterium]HOJ55056.1 flagellin [Phycisphaerae bacterium]HOL27797.1 flagellin [Phycisphaerae bacterium]HPP22006.1 flagellin [Phycisphaerae bacterium]